MELTCLFHELLRMIGIDKANAIVRDTFKF